MDNREDKKVSIIVPVYNGEKHIERCLNSLTAQTYENLEILVINDGSTDSTGSICDGLSKYHSNIKVLHEINQGVSTARNKGIEEALGEVLSFVDADDYLEKDTVTILMKLMAETQSDVAGCSFHSFNQEEHEMNQEETHIEVLSGREFIEKGILSGDTRCWSKLYMREIIGDLRFDTTMTIGEDMLFLLALATQGARFSRTNYKGYGYFVNEDGAMNQRFRDSYMDQIRCWKKAVSEITEIIPKLRAKAVSILMISILLVVGKLAMLPGKERINYKSHLKTCSDELLKCRKVKGAMNKLPLGYKIKTRAYLLCPSFYLWGYHLLKGKQ